jgi:hypothetical protein
LGRGCGRPTIFWGIVGGILFVTCKQQQTSVRASSIKKTHNNQQQLTSYVATNVAAIVLFSLLRLLALNRLQRTMAAIVSQQQEDAGELAGHPTQLGFERGNFLFLPVVFVQD